MVNWWTWYIYWSKVFGDGNSSEEGSLYQVGRPISAWAWTMPTNFKPKCSLHLGWWGLHRSNIPCVAANARMDSCISYNFEMHGVLQAHLGREVFQSLPPVQGCLGSDTIDHEGENGDESVHISWEVRGKGQCCWDIIHMITLIILLSNVARFLTFNSSSFFWIVKIWQIRHGFWSNEMKKTRGEIYISIGSSGIYIYIEWALYWKE